VYGWLRAYREKGELAFAVKKACGPKQRLSDGQLGRLYSLVVGKDPRQLQFEFGLWTRNMVRELIAREFGVEMTPQGVGALLGRMGLSAQRPLVRAYEQDPERVRRWKEEEFPAIRERAKAVGASIFFGDEASVRTDHHRGTTWAPVGRTPVVRGSGKRKSLNMVSAVSAQGKLHFCFADGNINAESFIEYLKRLLHDIDGPIFLILDGHSAHKAKLTQEFVASTGGRLELFFLPPYSPELNPDEWVWKNLKHDRVGRMAARSVEEMRRGILKAVERLVAETQIVLGFFRDPDLAYIAGSL
jgi:transposase